MKGIEEAQIKNIIRIVDIIEGRICMSSDDGDKVLFLIKKHFKEEKQITISFAETTDHTTAFQTAAFGPLFNGEFAETVIEANLKIVDIDEDDLYCLKRVFERAKEYYKDPAAYDRVVERALEGDFDY